MPEGPAQGEVKVELIFLLAHHWWSTVKVLREKDVMLNEDAGAVVAADITVEQFPSENKVTTSPVSTPETTTWGVVDVPEVGFGCIVKFVVTSE